MLLMAEVEKRKTPEENDFHTRIKMRVEKRRRQKVIETKGRRTQEGKPAKQQQASDVRSGNACTTATVVGSTRRIVRGSASRHD